MAERPFGHESSAINVRRVLTAMGVLALFLVIAVGVLYLVSHRVMPNHAQVLTRRGALPPTPRLQPDPATDIAAERAQKQALLARYAWIDPGHRFARIPIQRAMQLYVEQAAQHAAQPASPASGRSAR